MFVGVLAYTHKKGSLPGLIKPRAKENVYANSFYPESKSDWIRHSGILSTPFGLNFLAFDWQFSFLFLIFIFTLKVTMYRTVFEGRSLFINFSSLHKHLHYWRWATFAKYQYTCRCRCSKVLRGAACFSGICSLLVSHFIQRTT